MRNDLELPPGLGGVEATRIANVDGGVQARLIEESRNAGISLRASRDNLKPFGTPASSSNFMARARFFSMSPPPPGIVSKPENCFISSIERLSGLPGSSSPVL